MELAKLRSFLLIHLTTNLFGEVNQNARDIDEPDQYEPDQKDHFFTIKEVGGLPNPPPTYDGSTIWLYDTNGGKIGQVGINGALTYMSLDCLVLYLPCKYQTDDITQYEQVLSQLRKDYANTEKKWVEKDPYEGEFDPIRRVIHALALESLGRVAEGTRKMLKRF